MDITFVFIELGLSLLILLLAGKIKGYPSQFYISFCIFGSSCISGMVLYRRSNDQKSDSGGCGSYNWSTRTISFN